MFWIVIALGVLAHPPTDPASLTASTLNSSKYCRLRTPLSRISILHTTEVCNFSLYVKSRQGHIDSCADVSDTLPEVACGQIKRPRSSLLANSIRPWPSNQSTLRMSPRRPRKTKT